MKNKWKMILAFAIFTLIAWMGIVWFTVDSMVVYMPEVETVEPITVKEFEKLSLKAPVIVEKDPILVLINGSRAEIGLNSLVINGQLMQSAKLKGQDMVKYDYWSHISPSGVTPWHWIDMAGYSYLIAGENLARGFHGNWTVEHDGWMASPSHKENILGDYNQFGYYVTEYEHGNQLVVTHFGRSK